MATVVTWDQVPDEVRAAVEPHVERWRHLIPPYYREVRIVYDTQEDEGSLWTQCRPEYRIATIGVAPNFLEVADVHRREANVVHELIHMAIEPMRDCYLDLMKAAIGDDDASLHAWAESQWEAKMEESVCDLTEAVLSTAVAPVKQIRAAKASA